MSEKVSITGCDLGGGGGGTSVAKLLAVIFNRTRVDAILVLAICSADIIERCRNEINSKYKSLKCRSSLGKRVVGFPSRTGHKDADKFTCLKSI